MTSGFRLDVPERTEEAHELAHGPFKMPRILTTERLVLCPFEQRHHEPIARLFADEQAAKFIGGTSDVSGSFSLLCAFAGQWGLLGFGEYAVLDHCGDFLGGAGLWMPIDWPELEMGYFFLPEAQGKGYASEAVRAIREEAVRRGVRTLVSYIDPRNAPSIALAERVGATLDGPITLRDKAARVYRHPIPSVEPAHHDDDIPYFPVLAMPRRIETKRLVLSAWQLHHFEPFAALLADPDTTRFTTGVLTRREAWNSMIAAAGSWQLRGYGTYAIEVDGEFSGWCGLYNPYDWPEIELAYTLAPHARGRGLAQEAIDAVKAIAATQGLSRLVSYVHPQNAASLRAAERSGAVREGTISLRDETAVVYAHAMDFEGALAA
ncbi:MAG: GNAT family N-acetyltransferase [Pseudomonadota bacterium]